MGTLPHTLTFRDLGLTLFVPSASLIAYLLASGRYSQRLPFWSETGLVVTAGLFLLVIEAFAAILSGEPERHAPQLAAILLFTICAPVTNRLVKHALARIGMWRLPSLVVSRSNAAAEPQISPFAPDTLDYRIVGQVDPSSLLSDPEGPRLRPLLARYHCEHLFIGFDDDPPASRILADAALRERIPFSLIVPSGFRCTTTHAFGKHTMLLSHSEGPLQGLLRRAKTAVDVTAAAFLLLAASPFLLAIAVAIRLDGGSALFGHRRLGANGEYFHCLKFRTMVADADRVLEQILATDAERAQEWNATQKLRDDPRITRIGQFLRKTG
jgi:undecaprenyl-phosphate galactose phosphotransferase